MISVLWAAGKEIDSLIDKYSDKEFPIFGAADTNLLVVNVGKSLEETGFSVKRDTNFEERLNRLSKSNYPIPNFYKLNLDNGERTRSQLSHDFKIIVIRSEKGLFGDFDKLADRRYVPKVWEHGFSKGIAISKKQALIIYWVAIW